jgi:hypothetical protein
MQCAAIILSKLPKAMREEYAGQIVAFIPGNAKLCGRKQESHSIEHKGVVFNACGTHMSPTMINTVAWLENLGHPKGGTAVITQGADITHVDVRTHEESTQLGMELLDPFQAAEFPDEEENKPMTYVVAGTGSRELQTAPIELKRRAVEIVDAHLDRLLAAHGENLIIMSGMAEGFDKLLALRALAKNIRLWCAIPNRNYGQYYWGHHSLTGQNRLDEFNSIVERAHMVTYVRGGVDGYSWFDISRQAHQLPQERLHGGEGR